MSFMDKKSESEQNIEFTMSLQNKDRRPLLVLRQLDEGHS